MFFPAPVLNPPQKQKTGFSRYTEFPETKGRVWAGRFEGGARTGTREVVVGG